LLDCHILQHREELEEITTAAVKEEQIETKLAGIESDWVALNLVSAPLAVRFQQLHRCT
jgi:dynein heavy chain